MGWGWVTWNSLNSAARLARACVRMARMPRSAPVPGLGAELALVLVLEEVLVVSVPVVVPVAAAAESVDGWSMEDDGACGCACACACGRACVVGGVVGLLLLLRDG